MRLIKCLFLLVSICYCCSGCSGTVITGSAERLYGGDTAPEVKIRDTVEIDIDGIIQGLDDEMFPAYAGDLELPIEGSSGYCAISQNLYNSPDGEVLCTLDAGEGFTVLEESDLWWRVRCNSNEGWVYHPFCFVNLPDVIPSIVYLDTNASASLFKSVGKQIPQVTGEKLYEAYTFNDRLGQSEYIIPVLYSMSYRIAKAQKQALQDGNTLVIYEGFRPYDVQQKVNSSLRSLANVDSEVNRGITKSPWSLSWFISSGISNHQMGYAIDVSLGKVIDTEYRVAGHYRFLRVNQYEAVAMPSPMHELSYLSASMQYPVNPNNADAWHSADIAPSMNHDALLLRTYCTSAGLSPLASEWWHFNDLYSAKEIRKHNPQGKFRISEVYGEKPSV